MSTSFLTAESLDEALGAMAGGARPIAGGTDLVVGARSGKAPLPDSLVAIDRLVELRRIDAGQARLTLGALVSHAAAAADEVVRERFAALADACSIVGSEATRVHGTIGGNIMNASPAMEIGGPLLCFDAVVTLRSAAGERTLPIGDLLTGPGRTSAQPGELLTAVELTAPSAGGSCYARLEYRRQMEIAVAGATCVVSLDEGDRIEDARIALTALAPTVVRVPEAEARLVGTDGGRAAAEKAAEAAAAAARPISDVRASARYRQAIAAVLVRRVIEAAVARARGEVVPIPASQSLFGAA